MKSMRRSVAIGLGPKVDRQVLEDLAGRSGGEAFFPGDRRRAC